MRIMAFAIFIFAVISMPVSAEPSAVAYGVEPAFSSDGRLIAYTGMEGGARDIFVISDEGRKRQLTSDIYWDGEAAFSASDSIVFISDRSGSRELWQVGLDGSGLKQLTSDEGWKSSPSVGPDGAVIFVAGRHPSQDIYILEAGNVRRLTTLDDEVYSPVWSPDGDKIAFVRGDELITINRDGTRLEQIATGVYSRGLSWGKDGRLLYLTRNVGYDLWSVTIEGGEKELIYEGVTDSWEVNPAINTHGKVAFATDKDGFYTIYVMEIDISGVQIKIPAPTATPVPASEPVLTPQNYPVEAPVPAPLPAVEIIEERIPENMREELENPQKSELTIPDSRLPDDFEIPEPSIPEEGEIEIPDWPLPEEGEMTIDDEHIDFWLLAASALLVLIIQRQKSKRPKYNI